MLDLKGVMQAPVTPLKSDFSFDPEGFAKMVEFHVRHGAPAIAWPHHKAESLNLTIAERKLGAEIAVKTVAKRVPVSIFTGTLSEEGVLGLLVLLTLLLLTLAFAGHNAILGRDTYGIGSAALLASWCGLLANSVFIDTLHWRHFWLLAALIWAGAARPGQGSPGQTWSPTSSRGTRSASFVRR